MKSGVAIIASSSVPFAAMAVLTKSISAAVPSAQIVAMRFFIGVLGAGVMFAAALHRPDLRRWRLLLARGFFGGVAVTCYFFAIAQIGAGPATMLNYPSPVYASVFAAVLFKERPGLVLYVGLVLATLGAVLVSYQRVEDVLEKWEFVRETDEFRWNGVGQTAYSPQVYQGYSIVSPNTASILEERLKQYSVNTQKKEFETILALVGQMHILAQPLRGLHDAFLMRDQILRPQPINPEIFPSEDAPSPAVTAIPPASPLDPIAALLAGLQNFSLPDPNTPFFPVRAGHLHLLQIGIIDAFGQRVNVPLTQLLRTASLTPSGAPMEPLIRKVAIPGSLFSDGRGVVALALHGVSGSLACLGLRDRRLGRSPKSSWRIPGGVIPQRHGG